MSDTRAGVERDPLLAQLSLRGLREYRRALGHEESRVSYWRRILQGRLDTLRTDGPVADVDNLGAMLTDDRVSGGRTALIQVVPADDIPPLPNLAALWERTAVAEGADRDGLIEELVAAESQLSSYRTALHQRLGAATAELIGRYREEPSLCLDVLPVQHPTPHSATGA